MKIEGQHYRTIWPVESASGDAACVEVIDQTQLPHRFHTQRLCTSQQAAEAIRNMVVRGAPLIGATAAYGLAMGVHENAADTHIDTLHRDLLDTRPTAVNLRWALDRMRAHLLRLPEPERAQAAWQEAAAICESDVKTNHQVARHGLCLIEEIVRHKDEPINILTHCNAGWLGTVDWGTALAPIYLAHDAGLPVHVWVDETRPRVQGALTAWELAQHGVPHTVIVDNAGGHLMQQGQVDMVITGCDRVTANGDVCNKIGTYLKALAAQDNSIPFYVATPGPTIDWSLTDGHDIPIEQRAAEEVTHFTGLNPQGELDTVQPYPLGTVVANYGFDVTPAALVTALITERGLCKASTDELKALFI